MRAAATGAATAGLPGNLTNFDYLAEAAIWRPLDSLSSFPARSPAAGTMPRRQLILNSQTTGNVAERGTFDPVGVTTEVGTMKKMASAIVFSLAVMSAPALAQTNSNTNVQTPSAQNSGAGIAGQPGNKNGPPAKGTVGSSTSTQSETVQDAAKIKGMPGNKSGPPAKQPSR
jgi:hypothetical protein